MKRGSKGPNTTSFRIGHVAWNKGLQAKTGFTCSYCGKTFESYKTKWTNRYCSNVCRFKAWPKWVPTKPKLPCEWCKRPEINRESRFCSRNCYQKYLNAVQASRTCKRCNITRPEMRQRGYKDIGFNMDYCRRCYGLLKRNNFDPDLAELSAAWKSLTVEKRKRFTWNEIYYNPKGESHVNS